MFEYNFNLSLPLFKDEAVENYDEKIFLKLIELHKYNYKKQLELKQLGYKHLVFDPWEQQILIEQEPSIACMCLGSLNTFEILGCHCKSHILAYKYRFKLYNYFKREQDFLQNQRSHAVEQS